MLVDDDGDDEDSWLIPVPQGMQSGPGSLDRQTFPGMKAEPTGYPSKVKPAGIAKSWSFRVISIASQAMGISIASFRELTEVEKLH